MWHVYCANFLSDLPKIEDPRAIPARKTEEYYQPTFDQEQGSTRGNMIVLEHYWLKVLDVPKDVFEDTSFSVLGERSPLLVIELLRISAWSTVLLTR